MKKELVLAALLAAAPFTAFAGSLNYSYVEGGYAHLAQDDVFSFRRARFLSARPEDVKSDGFFGAVSVAVGESFYGFGSVRRGTDTVEVQVYDTFMGRVSYTYDADVTVTRLNLGAGYHYGLSDSTDLLAEVSAIDTDLDIEDESEDDGGYPNGFGGRVSVGVRSALTDAFEIWGKGNYTSGEFYDSELSASVGMQYRFGPTWGITGEIESGSSYSQYTLGVRASF
ncbi:hypothetical protein HIV01_012215 [Lysobacter arenosi]|uniref:Outer membrane protein beta-barrel domain-containing protein n=1 Tax=Lysobacter arenosi TaxID=2795387 RepID=A0ABX7R788_9GAMM|nr:hypothetical protein [Lysobacter arenosi]QSX73983.1 hypothetical protein HIV01_012215 [Lysobacter arenosi]